MTAGIELTRGTKKIIQEAIESVSYEHRNNRFRLCEEFCKIVEERYAGGAMSYQLKRMGNTYPFSLLSENAWTIQDALDNDLTVSVKSDWFSENPFKQSDDGSILEQRTVSVQPTEACTSPSTSIDKLNAMQEQGAALTTEVLESLSLEPIFSGFDIDKTTTFKLWTPVSAKKQALLEDKMFWLSELVTVRQMDGDVITMGAQAALNLTEVQAKSRGLFVGKENNVKVSLNSTGTILEAIDKYLYDETGQYSI